VGAGAFCGAGLDGCVGELDGCPARDGSDPLEVDVLDIDEAAMLGQPTATHLLDAVKAGSRVGFVGDPNQLPASTPATCTATWSRPA